MDVTNGVDGIIAHPFVRIGDAPHQGKHGLLRLRLNRAQGAGSSNPNVRLAIREQLNQGGHGGCGIRSEQYEALNCRPVIIVFVELK
jgi:hypothetical protein